MTHKPFTWILLLAGLLAIQATAQYNRPENRIWAMGNTIGLDFSSGAPVPFRSSLSNATEGSATVSDANGNLLFYTNGATVWNRIGNTMPRGINFTGAGGTFTISTTQGAVIVPIPDSAGKYYIFSLSSVSNCKLYCSKIDMSLDGGMGDIDTSFYLHKTRIDSNLTEKMIAVAGCNNNIWLLVHSDTGTLFKAYEITSAGINLNPVISYAGQYPAAYYRQGVMKISPDRQRLMTCNFRASGPTDAGLEVYDFNFSTGVVSNARLVDTFSYYGGTFSPDNSKLYAQTTAVMNEGTVFQFDLDDPLPISCKFLLGPSGQYADMRLGPDGKIYFGALAAGQGWSNYMYMGRINAPNNLGTACDFQDTVTALRLATTAGTVGALTQGLPNEVPVPSGSTDTLVYKTDTLICSDFAPFTVYAPAEAYGFTWQDGSNDSAYTITQRGTYRVVSLTPCPRIDSFIIRGADFPDTWHITVNGYVLGTSEAFDSYQWYRDGQRLDGATSREYTVTENGWHAVKVDIGPCSDSIAYYVNNVSIADPGNLAYNVRIYPNPANGIVHIAASIPVHTSISSLDGKVVLLHHGNVPIDISTLQPGIYMIRITDQHNALLKTEKLVKTAQ